MFDKPKGVALDSFGNLYVVDSGWSNVQIFNEKGDVLLFFGGRGAYPGLLKNPSGIAIDAKNRISWIHEEPSANGWARVTKVDPQAELSHAALPGFRVKLGEV